MKRLITFLLLSLYVFEATAQENLYLGGDVSNLYSYILNGVSYYDQNGKIIYNITNYFKKEEVGWNAMRVRLFVNPKQKDWKGDTDVQVCQDIEYVVTLCKKLKKAGYSILLDFHYSDTWADPNSQWIPEEWADIADADLPAKIYDYTKECLQRLVDEGVAPDFIQPGNETSYGMLFSVTPDFDNTPNKCKPSSPKKNWSRFINILNHATAACREICPDAKIVLHNERLSKPDELFFLLNKLSIVDYDIIGLSYYPFWHGSLENMSTALNKIATDYPDKDVHIVEIAYNYQYDPGVVFYDFTDKWPYTPEGQAKFIEDCIAELKKHSNVKGLYWWCPEENGNGPDCKVLSYWMNRGLWHNTTHKALPALYKTKQFLERETGVLETEADANSEQTIYYDMMGRKLNAPTDGIIIEKTGNKVQKVKY